MSAGPTRSRASVRFAVGRWLAVLAPLVAIALAAFTTLSIARAGGAPASGTGWAVRDAAGAVVALEPTDAGLPLAPGHVLHLDAAAGGGERFTALELEVVPGTRQSSYADVRLAGQRIEHRVYVVPGATLTAYAGVRRFGREWRELARAEVERPGVAEAPIRLELALAPGVLTVRCGGEPLLDVRDPELGVVARASLWTDDASVRAFSAELARAEGTQARLGEDFAGGWREELSGARRGAAARHAMLALLAAFLYVSSRRAERVPLVRRLLATLALVAPCAAPLALAAWLLPLPGAVTAVLAAAFAVPGLRLALTLVDADAAPPDARRRARAWIVAALLWTLATAAAAGAAGARAERAAESLRTARAAAAEESASFRIDAPVELDLSNALELPGVRRDIELSARVVIAPGALLELRLRSPAGQSATGIALCAGDVGRYGARFVREGNVSFEPIGTGEDEIPVGRAIELRVRARDDRFTAEIDGREVAAAECADFAAGTGALLAAAGTVTVEALALESLAPESDPPSAMRAALAGGALALGAVALAALLAARLLSQRAFHACETTAFLSLPIALLVAGDVPVPDTAIVLALGGTALLLLVHPPGAARGAGALRSAAFVLGCAPALALPLALALERAPEPELPDGLEAHVFPGPRLTPGIVSFEHPAIRRFNTWLRAHRLRGRNVPLAKPPGTLRVLCTGSSSTWGHGVPPESGRDYPSVLGELLRERMPELALESINGGVPGSNSARLYRFFGEVLLAHAPDVVTLSLTYNDTHHLTQLDEGPFLERVTAADHVQDAAEQRQAAELVAGGRRKLTRLLTSFAASGPPTAPLWAAIEDDPSARTPPERFAGNLRAWARLCAERGITLVLIKEPVRDDAPLVWKEEFRDAIDTVAAEFGLLVVDPTPALLAAGAGSTFFMDEVHPTPPGHAVIARALADALETLLSTRAETPPPPR